MYLPAKFKAEDQNLLIELMQSNPFATLITIENGIVSPNHLPLLTEVGADGKMILLGHMARANPQWKQFLSGQPVTVVFHGPHTYITPSWYADPQNVPTWNYAVVHVTGTPVVIDDFETLHAILDKTVTESEKSEPKPWKFELPEEYKAGLMKAIVGFQINVTEIEGKLKLSQNRSETDYQGVLSGLSKRQDEGSAQVRALMDKTRK